MLYNCHPASWLSPISLCLTFESFVISEGSEGTDSAGAVRFEFVGRNARDAREGAPDRPTDSLPRQQRRCRCDRPLHRDHRAARRRVCNSFYFYYS